MNKIQYFAAIAVVALTAGSLAAQDAAKGKATFDATCGACHEAATTNKKMGPGLKGLYKLPKLTNGKPVNDANVLERINTGATTAQGVMPPFKDMLSDGDKKNLIAYLKTL